MNAGLGKRRLITSDERRHIEEGLKTKKSFKQLAAELGRLPVVIRQEIKRGRRPSGEYSAEYAETLQQEALKNRINKLKKNPSTEEELLIRELYEKGVPIKKIVKQVKWGPKRLRTYFYQMGIRQPQSRSLLKISLSEEIESLKETVRTLTEIIKDMANERSKGS